MRGPSEVSRRSRCASFRARKIVSGMTLHANASPSLRAERLSEHERAECRESNQVHQRALYARCRSH